MTDNTSDRDVGERSTPEDDAARRDSERFISDLAERGEVVPEGEDLPPGATHEYVTEPDEDQPAVRRRRFSAH